MKKVFAVMWPVVFIVCAIALVVLYWMDMLPAPISRAIAGWADAMLRSG